MHQKNASALLNRQKALIRLALIAIGGAMLFSWLLYQSATAASELGTLQAQVIIAGVPMVGIPYTLTGAGITTGVTGDEGMIVERNIEQGNWALRAGCAFAVISVGDVAAQSPTVVDATCNYFVFMPEVLG